MFYSHEILTSRKYGVATVWLVATLGSKSTLRKINRKAILDVDIPKACNTITAPEAPMALRLQSNLLYGVSRVYSQQCLYVLTDVQAAQSNMRALLRTVKTSELDPDAGKARPDQLVLHDDPAFLPDLFLPDLDMDLTLLEQSTQASSQRTSMHSGLSQPSSRSSNVEGDEARLRIVIPSSDSGNAGPMGGFTFRDSEAGSVQQERISAGLAEAEAGFDPNIDFNFDEDGLLIELGSATRPSAAGTGTGAARLSRDSEFRAQIGPGPDDGRPAGQDIPGEPMDIDPGQFHIDMGEHDTTLPSAEPFPEMARPPPESQSFRRSSRTPEDEPSSSAEAAPVRRRRAPKVLPMDRTQMLGNTDLTRWNNDYIANMTEARAHKLHNKLPAQARKNAANWVFGLGIGGVGTGVGASKIPSPLDMFAGDKLLEALTGLPSTRSSQKRSRSHSRDGGAGSASDTDDRRTRLRSDDGEQIGRGEAGNDLPLFDDNDTGIELPRTAPTPLADASTLLPWNTTLSHRTTSRPPSLLPHPRPRLSSLPGFPTSAGRLPSSLDRRASRLVSASPLEGRGGPVPLPSSEGFEAEEWLGGMGVGSDDAAFEEFELGGGGGGGGAVVFEGGREEVVGEESGRFLEFVRGMVEGEEGEGEGEGGEIAFGVLLPPGGHVRTVAAQGFAHLLLLASRGLVGVRQEEGVGEIWVRVVGSG